MVISIEIMFFQVRENLKNISKTNIILTFFTLAKNSPRDFSIFFFHTSWTGRTGAFQLSLVCGGFDESTCPRRVIKRKLLVQNSFAALKKNM